MEPINIPELVERLGSEEDSVRKMAAFRLQSSIGDPSFAENFILEGGLKKLHDLTLHASGNTLAYGLSAYSNLLEVDNGWECVDAALVKRVVELVVTHPLVNVLRGAMSILAAIVSHPPSSSPTPRNDDAPDGDSAALDREHFGFRALKPAIAAFPQFLEMLVNRLTSADHALCANALQLINALMRDAVTHGSAQEWPKFIKRLQDLGVIRAVYGLMQGSAVADVAQPLLEFQALTKVLVRRWRDVAVDFDKVEHRRALKGIHISSLSEAEAEKKEEDRKSTSRSRRHAPPDWKKLGFPADAPGEEFAEVGFLGMMDLTDYVRKNETGFQRLLLEQGAMPEPRRCPIAQASIAVTAILYEHFEIDKAGLDDGREYLAMDTRESLDQLFKPMLLQWSKVHTAGLNAFIRLWKTASATIPVDFPKIAELVRILLEAVLGSMDRTKDVHAVEEDIAAYTLPKLRKLQQELFELAYYDAWRPYLKEMHDDVRREATDFIKEQRIRCLLAGAWFPSLRASAVANETVSEEEHAWGFVRLSHNRRFLHYGGYKSKGTRDYSLEELPEKLDLHTVSSVVSNVNNRPSSSSSTLRTFKTHISINSMVVAHLSGSNSAGPSANGTSSGNRSGKHAHHNSKPSGGAGPSHQKSSSVASVSTINAGSGPAGSAAAAPSGANGPPQRREIALLTLHPGSADVAAEWMDGLLMLLHQPAITKETAALVTAATNWGVKIRLLNVRFDEEELGVGGPQEVPSREGLDDEYYYDMGMSA